MVGKEGGEGLMAEKCISTDPGGYGLNDKTQDIWWDSRDEEEKGMGRRESGCL